MKLAALLMAISFVVLPAVPGLGKDDIDRPDPKNNQKSGQDLSGVLFYKNREIDTRIARAWMCLARSDYKQAQALVDQALIISPTCGQAMLIKGYCLVQFEKTSAAIDCIKRALHLLPDGGKGALILPGHGPDWAYHVLVAAEIEARRPADGYVSASDGLKIYKDSTQLYVDRADASRELNRAQDAVADFTTAIKLGRGESYYDRARAYMDLKKGDLAARDLTAAIALQPNDIRLYGTRARAYEMCGQKALAAKDRDTARKMGENAF